ncbi:hypothetical protein EIP91_001913 [Steccherinum ochraceum]|uniref:Clathrin/coatomer adaptor adaptin-like N-terminal domain-containing protein n=1 Tax=Steccherinum ochraceum TaxID=92696 RepID=A0A4R0RGV7_9APHY|nr:hypothetical protein EIP91_001913 [Steccherinum ochraceum]
MEVPFTSSGAMSRAHYALIRKVETAASAHTADAVLYAEAEVVQSRLQNSALTLKQVKESLVLLLYCRTAAYPGAAFDVESALPHAISLAEAGKTVQDKRIGYLFCTETMPRDHELQLMLVNTLRKDLECASIPRICLALDTVIQFAPEDVYPAIQDRLYELLSHISPHIRRRALLAFRTLSEQDTDVLKKMLDKMRKRMNDQDLSVVDAALTLSIVLVRVKLMSGEHFHPLLTKVLRRTWNARADQTAWSLLFKILQNMQVVKPSHEDFEIMQEIVSSQMRNMSSLVALKYQCFLVTAAHPQQVSATTASIFIKGVRHLLVSEDPNAIYTFVSCLHCLDPGLWAGSADNPPVLEGWEVERIMNLLWSDDAFTRKQTLRTLLRVDRSIVEAYFDKLNASLDSQTDVVRRSLQVIDILSGDDGEFYAQHLVHQIRIIGDDASHRHLLQDAVEMSLLRIRDGAPSFRSAALGVLFTILTEQHDQLGPTLLTIIAALICEFLDSSPTPPERILQSLAKCIPLYQAKCESVPEESLQIVRKVQETAGRHIKRRIEQFLNLSHDKQALAHLLASSGPLTDPDELLSRTVTAGDLALASGRRDLKELAASPMLSSTSPPPVHVTPADDLSSQVDLLGLDSPFISEPPASASSSVSADLDFEKIWNTLAHANSRGWCEVTIDVVVRKLQSMQHTLQVTASDQPPFQGELKIILTPSLSSEHQGIAVVRLKESEDESCLWQLRCADDNLRSHIRNLLTDVEQ